MHFGAIGMYTIEGSFIYPGKSCKNITIYFPDWNDISGNTLPMALYMKFG